MDQCRAESVPDLIRATSGQETLAESGELRPKSTVPSELMVLIVVSCVEQFGQYTLPLLAFGFWLFSLVDFLSFLASQLPPTWNLQKDGRD